jgi:hypothetical protein
MSRLYYAKPPNQANLASGDQQSAAKDYLEKISKLIPSEVLALWLGLVGLIPAVELPISKPWLYAGAFVLCLILTPFYLSAMADKGKPKLVHLIVSTIAFPFWAYSISGASVIPKQYSPALAGMLILIFTAISGLIPLG